MTEMEGFVGIRRRVFNHHQWTLFCHGAMAIVLVVIDGLKHLQPCFAGDDEVKEALHHIEGGNGLTVLLEILAQLLCHLLGLLAGHLDKGEHHEGEMSLKLTFCLLQQHHIGCHILAIEHLDALDDLTGYFVFNCHNMLGVLSISYC